MVLDVMTLCMGSIKERMELRYYTAALSSRADYVLRDSANSW